MLALVVLHLLWMSWFHQIGNNYFVLNADTLQALDWVGRNAEPEAKVYTMPQALGPWIGGLEKRRWGPEAHIPLARDVAEEGAFRCTAGWLHSNNCQATLGAFGFTHLLIDWATWQTGEGLPADARALTNASKLLDLRATFNSVQVFSVAVEP